MANTLLIGRNIDDIELVQWVVRTYWLGNEYYILCLISAT